MKKRRKAAMTMTRNESVFLELWYEHTRKYFDPEDIFVLNHQSSDGSVERVIEKGLPERNVTPITVDLPHSKILTSISTAFQHKLLDRYDFVLFAETDEFVFPDVTRCPGGFDELMADLDRRGPTVIRCLGYDILHDWSREPAIDFTKRPLLRQRSKARIWTHELSGSTAFSKPIFTSRKVTWCKGQHDLADVPHVGIDDRLVLIHCHFIDIDVCEKRRSTRVKPGEHANVGDRTAVGAELRAELSDWLCRFGLDIPEHLKDQF